MPGFTDLKPEGRKASPRPEGFNQASRATVLRGIPSDRQPKAAEIMSKGEQVRGRMREVFHKHRDKWQAKTYQHLLKNEGFKRDLRPAFAVPLDKATELQAKAQRLVDGRQARRLAKVSIAETKRLQKLLPYKAEFKRAATVAR